MSEPGGKIDLRDEAKDDPVAVCQEAWEQCDESHRESLFLGGNAFQSRQFRVFLRHWPAVAALVQELRKQLAQGEPS